MKLFVWICLALAYASSLFTFSLICYGPWWFGPLAVFGVPNHLDRIGANAGVERNRGKLLWETNQSYRKRITCAVRGP